MVPKKRIVDMTAVCILFLLFHIIQPTAAGDRFTDNGDGTVTDQVNRLMWAQTDNQGDITWEDAKAWVKYTYEMLDGKGYTNWRLPTVRELESLYVRTPGYRGYKTEGGPVVKIRPEIKLSHIMAWSSEESINTGIVFDFNSGVSFAVPQHSPEGCRALPVRDLD